MKPIAIIFLLSIPLTMFAQADLFNQFLEKGKAEFNKQWDKQNLLTAIENLEKAVKLKPDNAEAHYFLGYAYDKYNSRDGSTLNNLNIALTMKASGEYEKVIALTPKYEGEILVLDPYSRLTSIWGSQAMSYMYQNKHDSAAWCLREGKKRGGFGDFFLAINRKTLALCPDSSILFTMGDNVTLPLIYLQTIENYRKDVSVVDANLLNARWYPRFLKEQKSISFSYSDAELDTLNYIRWDTTAVSVEFDNTGKSFTWKIPPTYADAFLLRGDRLLFDIIKRNKFRKSMFFTSGFNPKSMLGLRNYLTYYILLDKISVDVKAQLTDDDFYKLASDISKLFSLVNVNSQDNLHFLDMFRYIILDRMYMFNDEQHVEANVKLLNLLDEKLPVSKYPVLSRNLRDYLEKLHQDIK